MGTKVQLVACRTRTLDNPAVPRELFMAIHRLAEFAGVWLDGRLIGDPGVLQYDGHTIGVGKQSITNIIHDIAHHMVAPEWRRQHPDWGLGPGVDEYSYHSQSTHDAPERFGGVDTQEQEELASLLGICIEAHLGLGTKTLDDHCWTKGRHSCWRDLATFFQAVNKLVDKGFITNDRGRPVCMDYIYEHNDPAWDSEGITFVPLCVEKDETGAVIEGACCQTIVKIKT